MDKQRFKKLYRLAHGGDMVAKADLWLEFQFAFDHDPLPAFMNPSTLPFGSSSVPSVVKNKSQPVPPSVSSAVKTQSSPANQPCK